VFGSILPWLLLRKIKILSLVTQPGWNIEFVKVEKIHKELCLSTHKGVVRKEMYKRSTLTKWLSAPAWPGSPSATLWIKQAGNILSWRRSVSEKPGATSAGIRSPWWSPTGRCGCRGWSMRETTRKVDHEIASPWENRPGFAMTSQNENRW